MLTKARGITWVTLPGLSEYNATLKLMEDTVNRVISKSIADTIYLVEHNDVYTAGSSFNSSELLNPKNIPVIYTGRGGKFTYHGPGQRVIYPIIDLSQQKDLKLYIRMLETWIINTLAVIGIKAYTLTHKIGIWTKYKNSDAKIGAIGVRVKKWVTYHGVAVNISNDIDKFSGIIPCGLINSPVTSLTNLGINIALNEFDNILQKEFYNLY